MSDASEDRPALFEADRAGYSAGGVQILSDVSLRIRAGALIAVIGPNGSGKTTLLRLVMGLIQPTQGRLTWTGIMPKRAIVFQKPTLLRRTVAGNLRFALSVAGVPPDQREAQSRDLLELVGLWTLRDRPARRLSGGEQQRLAVARALARRPKLLLLDEPTASLDPAATRTLEDLVRRISRPDTTVILTTHDLGQARRLAEEIVLLHRGRVIETGSAAEFFEVPKTVEARRFAAGDLLL